jgi:plasmid maintenance system antidote protein VapI
MQKSSTMENFINQISEIMRKRGLTLAATAELIGIDRGNLSRILNGKEGLTLDRADRIASSLGLELCVTLTEKRKKSVA